jgi:hypothetical protein
MYCLLCTYVSIAGACGKIALYVCYLVAMPVLCCVSLPTVGWGCAISCGGCDVWLVAFL